MSPQVQQQSTFNKKDEELLNSNQTNDNLSVELPTKKSRKLQLFKLSAYLSLIAVVFIVAFTAGWFSSWVTNDSIRNSMHEGSWSQSPIDDVRQKQYDSVMEVSDSELQVINSVSGGSDTEWGGLNARSLFSTNSSESEEMGDRTVLKDPTTKKPAFYVDREFVRDLALGQIVDEDGAITDESFRISITDAVTGDRAEIIPLSLSMREDFNSAEASESIDTASHPTFYFQWNGQARAILQSNAEEGDMDLLWPKNSGDVQRANSFLDRFMELYEPFIEAQAALSFDEDDLFYPEQDLDEAYDENGTIETRDLSKRLPVKRTQVDVRGNLLSAWYRRKNCWVTYCRPIQVKKWKDTKSRSKCGNWLSFGRWIIKTVSKRCHTCPRRKNKCNGYPASDPRACSGNGECKRGKCYCKQGFAGGACDTCSCRYDKQSYPSCNKCAPKYGGEDCKGCADGYWPSPLCWIKRRCHGIYFDSPSVCSGHGSCNDGISVFGKCSCHTGWSGSKCDRCAPQFTGENCDKCVPGFAGPNCDERIKCGGIEFDNPLVCSGYGNCTIVDPESPQGLCKCDADHKGTLCNEKIIRCAGIESDDPNVCSARGTCLSEDTCSCQNGYFGENCENTKKCNGVAFNDPNVCSGSTQGTCVGSGTDTHCECQEKWSGVNCDVPKCFGIAAGSDNTCSGKGTCVAPDTCQCEAGYYGADCSTPRSCNGLLFNDPSVCSGNGVCAGNNATGTCQCEAGKWTGSDCNVPLCNNIAASESSSCSAHGDCEAPDSCSCDPEYSGQWCETPRKCFGKTFDDASVCSGNGQCVDEDVCQCASGFNGTTCDSCALPRVDIASKCATCLPQFDNTDYPSCEQCHPGFGPEGVCTSCIAGFFPDGNDCHACNCDADGSESSSCSSTGVCTCKEGYSGSKCSLCDPDYYENTDGQCEACSCNMDGVLNNDASCDGTGQCTCDDAHSGKQCQIKRQCQGVDYDSADVCSAHGTCVGEDNCQCSDGWTGSNCDIPVCFGNSTASTVCSGHGVCDAPNTCTCSTGYSGSKCDKKLSCNGKEFDDADVCNGKGVCTGEGSAGVCECSAKFTGPNCAVCSNTQFTGAECDQCIVGYTGSECTDCASGYFQHTNSTTCENCACGEGSTSTSCEQGTGRCTCQDGFKSAKCDVACGCDATGSSSTTCDQNTGQCSCKPGWNGLICDTPRTCFGRTFNDPDVCGGHGSCVAEDQCECESGYEGDQCTPSGPTCFGKQASDPSVCSGRGVCEAQDTCVCASGFFIGKECGVELKWANGDTSYTWPTNVGRHSIIQGPALPFDGSKYVWTMKITADGYWPGRLGISFGVASYPQIYPTAHEVGMYADEWAFRGRDGLRRHVDTAHFGTALRTKGEYCRIELDTATGVGKVYTKRLGESSFSLEANEIWYTGIAPPEGTVMHIAASAMAWKTVTLELVE